MSAAIESPPPAECDWPTTNCYIDAWMGMLTDWGLDPMAGLGVTAAQDYEGDQFTFFKYLPEDLELLYGIVVGELSIYRSLEEQIEQQVRLGHVVLVEVDGFHLPDTRATSYQTQHTKTTIAVERIDIPSGRLEYYHNTGRYSLAGDDYAGVFRKLPGQASVDALPPYVEFIKRRFSPLTGRALTDAAIDLLRKHLRKRPDANPIQRYRDDFPRHAEWLIAHPECFHEYAFNNFRQLGANFELLARHTDWLETQGFADLTAPRNAARTISATAKALQFKVARIASKSRFDPCDAMFDALDQCYQRVMAGLDRAVR
jgi:hypothetical protein